MLKATDVSSFAEVSFSTLHTYAKVEEDCSAHVDDMTFLTCFCQAVLLNFGVGRVEGDTRAKLDTLPRLQTKHIYISVFRIYIYMLHLTLCGE